MRNPFSIALASFTLLALGLSGAALADSGSPAPAAASGSIAADIISHLPPAPAGFSWQLYHNAFFLQPDGWHTGELETEKGGVAVLTHAESPEEFSTSKQFETGFTADITIGTKAYGHTANQTAMGMLKMLISQRPRSDVQALDQGKEGNFTKYYLRYRDAPPGLTPIIVQKFLLADDAMDAMYCFTFESPEAKWQESWDKYGQVLLGKLGVVPNLPVR